MTTTPATPESADEFERRSIRPGAVWHDAPSAAAQAEHFAKWHPAHNPDAYLLGYCRGGCAVPAPPGFEPFPTYPESEAAEVLEADLRRVYDVLKAAGVTAEQFARNAQAIADAVGVSLDDVADVAVAIRKESGVVENLLLPCGCRWAPNLEDPTVSVLIRRPGCDEHENLTLWTCVLCGDPADDATFVHGTMITGEDGQLRQGERHVPRKPKAVPA